MQQLEIEKKGIHDARNYHRSQMKQEIILQRLKERGYRITKQRRMLLDIIMKEECSCCKEIYYKASKLDEKIGASTVYRMINTLEEIGAISRKNMYKISCNEKCKEENVCTIEFEDNTVMELSAKNWSHIVEKGLVACGYSKNSNLRAVIAKPCIYGEDVV